MTCANVLVGLGKIVKGWRLAMLNGDAAICVAPVKGETKEITGEDYNK